jgi:hypothetical protein
LTPEPRRRILLVALVVGVLLGLSQTLDVAARGDVESLVVGLAFGVSGSLILLYFRSARVKAFVDSHGPHWLRNPLSGWARMVLPAAALACGLAFAFLPGLPDGARDYSEALLVVSLLLLVGTAISLGLTDRSKREAR